jgi:hypothetical protein
LQRFADLERRVTSLEKAEWRAEIGKVAENVTQMREQMANLNGRLAGYLVAGGILGAILSGLVQLVLRKP